MPWHYLELISTKATEVVLRRLCERIPAILRKDPIEVFIPVGNNRDLDTYELSTDTLVMIHPLSVASAMRLATVTGVVGMATVGDSRRMHDVLSVPDDYVQTLIKASEDAWEKRADGIWVGGFVRIIDGPYRDYCGTIDAVETILDRAIVRVELLTRTLNISTPVRNLLNLSHVPKEQRVFYYGPQVTEMPDHSAIACDLVHEAYKQEPVVTYKQMGETASGFRRTQSVAVIVRELAKGRMTSRQIAVRILTGIKKKKIKPTKNLHIIQVMVKDAVRERYLDVKDWKQITALHPELKLSDAMMVQIGKDSGMSLLTPPDQLCKDGRTKPRKRRVEAKNWKNNLDGSPRKHRSDRKVKV